MFPKCQILTPEQSGFKLWEKKPHKVPSQPAFIMLPMSGTGTWWLSVIFPIHSKSQVGERQALQTPLVQECFGAKFSDTDSLKIRFALTSCICVKNSGYRCPSALHVKRLFQEEKKNSWWSKHGCKGSSIPTVNSAPRAENSSSIWYSLSLHWFSMASESPTAKNLDPSSKDIDVSTFS